MAASNTILLVEDDEGIRETMAALLEDEDFVVLQAANGAEGLVKMRSTPLCLVLLDLWMPVMNGWQLLEELRADPALAQLPVVVISAAGEQPPPAGSAAYLRKPIRLDVLLAAVDEHRIR